MVIKWILYFAYKAWSFSLVVKCIKLMQNAIHGNHFKYSVSRVHNIGANYFVYTGFIVCTFHAFIHVHIANKFALEFKTFGRDSHPCYNTF